MKFEHLLSLSLGLVIGWSAHSLWLRHSESVAAEAQSYTTPVDSVSYTALPSTKKNNSRLSNTRLSNKSDVQGRNIGTTLGSKLDKIDALKAQVRKLLGSGESIDAVILVRSTLQEYPSDFSVTQYLAETLIERAEYSDAFELLYEHRLYIDHSQDERLLRYISQQTEKVHALLENNHKTSELIGLYEQLVNLHPDNTAYYLRLARRQIDSGEFLSAEQTLSGAANDAAFFEETDRLRELIAENRQQENSTDIKVPLVRRGEHFIVEVLFNNSAPARLMIDTGASMTVVKPEVLSSYGLFDAYDREAVWVNTANGKTRAYIQSLDSIRLGSAVVEPVMVGEMALSDLDADGLLGMNVLKKYQFYIDQEQAVLYLRP